MGDFISWITDLVSSIGGGASDLFAGLGEGASKLGSSAWQGISNNPWGAVGGALQGAGSLSPLLMGQGQQQGGLGMDAGALSQLQQPGAPTPQSLRRNIADAQSQGLSGASPDFMASMAGVTPKELQQLLGMNYNQPGGQPNG
jgi:hypothetical protein